MILYVCVYVRMYVCVCECDPCRQVKFEYSYENICGRCGCIVKTIFNLDINKSTLCSGS